MTQRFCQTCRAWYRLPDSQDGQCRLRPPTVFLVMASPPSIGRGGILGTQGQPQPVPISFWPVMGPDRNCLEWKDRVTKWQYVLWWCAKTYLSIKQHIKKLLR